MDGKSLGSQATPLNDLGEFKQLTWNVTAKATASCSQRSFPYNASTVQCKGLQKADASNAGGCAIACCEAGSKHCNTWQYAPSKGCWIGIAPLGGCTVNPKSDANWLGGQRIASFSFQNATLVALDATSKVLGTHTVLAPNTNLSKYYISLQLDVPSLATGTGSNLVLDGRDTALVRASIVDDKGALVSAATNRIAFFVISGPAVFAGISNGDPASHEFMKSPSVNSWGGLARGMFRVSADCVGVNRLIAQTLDTDRSTTISADCKGLLTPIVVEASSPGLESARIEIPVSADAASEGPLAIAAAHSRGSNALRYLADFVG